MTEENNNKKLLRRPKLAPIPDNLPKYEKPTTVSRTTKSIQEIREEIESDFQAFEDEIFNEKTPNKDSQLDKIPEHTFSSANESILLLKGRLPRITVCSIDQGLLPDETFYHKNIRQICPTKQSRMSNKTSKQYEDTKKLPLKPIKSQKMVYLDLFQQVRETIPLHNLALPKHIIIVQMAAMMRQQLEEDCDDYENLQCSVRKIPPNIDGDFSVGAKPKFEILLYENPEKPQSPLTSQKLCDILQADLETIKMERSKFKQYDNVTSHNTEDINISATQVSMMECYLSGQHTLDLKAHGIWEIPDLAPVFPYLVVLDLSYNHFQNIPREIAGLENLNMLILKNNPISKLSTNILIQLPNLKQLDCSYTLLTNLSVELFTHCSLEEIDLSYCKIQYFPSFTGTSNINILNLSGNPIRYFKKTFLKLPLEKLGLKDTWTKPIYWRDEVFEEYIIEKSWYFCDVCDKELDETSRNRIGFSYKYNHYIPILLTFCSDICVSTSS